MEQRHPRGQFHSFWVPVLEKDSTSELPPQGRSLKLVRLTLVWAEHAPVKRGDRFQKRDTRPHYMARQKSSDCCRPRTWWEFLLQRSPQREARRLISRWPETGTRVSR